jgi:hypothetical protein
MIVVDRQRTHSRYVLGYATNRQRQKQEAMIESETREQWLHRLPFIQGAIRREYWLAEGRQAAYGFVLSSNGTIAIIQIEIAEQQELMDTSNNQGSMSPTAGPRIYKESYLAGLRDALDIITTMAADGKPWSQISEIGG